MVGEQVVLGWYILELTDSAFMVGLALGVRNLPLLFAGIALVALTSRLGGLLGSLLAGFLIARLGSAAAYLAVAVGYLASALAMLPARPSDHASDANTGSMRADVFGFLGTIRRDRV